MNNKKKVVLAIDPGSEKLGGCCFDYNDFKKEESEYTYIESKQVRLCNTVNKLGSVRLNNFEKELLKIKEKYDVVEVIVEQPQLIRGYMGRAVINGKSYRLLGTIGLVLKHFDWVGESQNNSGYSKVFKMGRKNDKTEVRKVKSRQFASGITEKDFESIGEDEGDAICISYGGFLYHENYRVKKLVNNKKMLEKYCV